MKIRSVSIFVGVISFLGSCASPGQVEPSNACTVMPQPPKEITQKFGGEVDTKLDAADFSNVEVGLEGVKQTTVVFQEAEYEELEGLEMMLSKNICLQSQSIPKSGRASFILQANEQLLTAKSERQETLLQEEAKKKNRGSDSGT